LYELLGGWIGVQKTPKHIVTEQRLRLIAVSRVEYRQYKEAEEKQKEAERDARRNYR